MRCPQKWGHVLFLPITSFNVSKNPIIPTKLSTIKLCDDTHNSYWTTPLIHYGLAFCHFLGYENPRLVQGLVEGPPLSFNSFSVIPIPFLPPSCLAYMYMLHYALVKDSLHSHKKTTGLLWVIIGQTIIYWWGPVLITQIIGSDGDDEICSLSSTGLKISSGQIKCLRHFSPRLHRSMFNKFLSDQIGYRFSEILLTSLIWHSALPFDPLLYGLICLFIGVFIHPWVLYVKNLSFTFSFSSYYTFLIITVTHFHNLNLHVLNSQTSISNADPALAFLFPTGHDPATVPSFARISPYFLLPWHPHIRLQCLATACSQSLSHPCLSFHSRWGFH